MNADANGATRKPAIVLVDSLIVFLVLASAFLQNFVHLTSPNFFVRDFLDDVPRDFHERSTVCCPPTGVPGTAVVTVVTGGFGSPRVAVSVVNSVHVEPRSIG
jgi:hypothetical protein